MTDAADPLPEPRHVVSPRASGEFLDQGAQPLRWRPFTEPNEVLWVSPHARFVLGRSPRGGSPICFPWFGPAPAGAEGQPQHGFARSVDWRQVSVVQDEGVTVTHELTSDDVDTSGIPGLAGAWRLTSQVTFGRRFTQKLTVENRDRHDTLEFTEALHAYLAVGDIAHVHVEGLDGVEYFDKVTQSERTVTGVLRFEGQTDAVLRTTGPVHLVDPVLDRVVHVYTEGAANVVAWNPGAEDAAGVPDIGDAWDGFCCLEAANALEPVRLAPGASHTLTLRITLDDH